MGRVSLARASALGGAAAAAGVAMWLMVGTSEDPLDLVQGALVLVATFWLAYGAALGVLGLSPPREAVPEAPFTGRAAVLVPICNEDPTATFARIAAMDAELQAAGLDPQVDVAVLSDTRVEAVAVQEAICFHRLLAETGGEGRLFYRRRMSNRGRKAGNIEDFVRRSGAAYDYAVILDADSLMEGGTIARMLRRMEADPRLGLLQTTPVIVGARSHFGRAVAFAARFYGPVFARGLARLQGRTGPFWGHNAVVRVRAFAESCGLPELSGPPPFGGHVLSHDYVEAALLARAGWTVRLDPDLGGSYEEGPETILSFAKRDRRWCQGNLQHLRILLAPGLRGWSRFVFLQGIFAYVAPVLWIAFVLATLAEAVRAPEPAAGELVAVVVVLLFAPKALAAGAGWRRARAFGGGPSTLGSVAAELALSTLVAPVLLMFQARSVLQVLSGRDGGWPAQARGDGSIGWAAAWRATWWIVIWGAGALATAGGLAPALVPWLLPVAAPLCLAPALIVWTSRPARSRLFTLPEEVEVPEVVRRAARVHACWAEPKAVVAARPAVDLSAEVALREAGREATREAAAAARP